jgi:hypothetical protein
MLRLATNERISQDVNKQRFHYLITWLGSRVVVRNPIGADGHGKGGSGGEVG